MGSQWILVHPRFCLCPPRLESLFLPALWKNCNQILLAFKARFPGDSQSLCLIPRLGSLTWGSEPSLQCENIFGIIVLQFVGHSPGVYGILFFCDCVLPIILLQLLIYMEYLFWWVAASSCWWVFNSWLQFCYSCKMKWTHVLLHHNLGTWGCKLKK